jgi:hypothetical protein
MAAVATTDAESSYDDGDESVDAADSAPSNGHANGDAAANYPDQHKDREAVTL